MRGFLIAIMLVATACAGPTAAVEAQTVSKLATGDSDEKIAAIGALVAGADPRAAILLQALADGELQIAGKRVLIVRSGEATDAATGEKVTPVPAEREDVIANNRVRGAMQGALAALKLVAPDRATRLAAARELAGGADESVLTIVKKAP